MSQKETRGPYADIAPALDEYTRRVFADKEPA
jgi:hypothetical protein